MDTSGIYRRDYDLDTVCDICDWEGWVTLTEDGEDMTAWWHCPGCATRHDLILTDDRGLAHVLFILVVSGFAVTTVALLGRAWWLALAGLLIAVLPLAVVWYVSHTRKAHK